MVAYSTFASPLGELVLAGEHGALTAVRIGGAPDPSWVRDDGALAPAREQLAAYVAGERRSFDLALAPAGSPWQRRVWDAVTAIPYGATRTYGEVAAALGTPGAARAVGHANARNPICVVIPCHRLVGADGTLTGYAYGLGRKRALLELEGALAPAVAA